VAIFDIETLPYMILEPDTMPPHLLLATFGVITGFMIHYGLFIRGEWHVYAPRIAKIYGLLFICPVTGRFFLKTPEIREISNNLVLGLLGHVLGLMMSIVLYRAFSHPLNKASFPGPFWARMTKLWHVWHVRDSKNHLFLEKLREKYGDVIRTGKRDH
jgi:tryprostatin B 6-hydroxylase